MKTKVKSPQKQEIKTKRKEKKEKCSNIIN